MQMNLLADVSSDQNGVESCLRMSASCQMLCITDKCSSHFIEFIKYNLSSYTTVRPPSRPTLDPILQRVMHKKASSIIPILNRQRSSNLVQIGKFVGNIVAECVVVMFRLDGITASAVSARLLATEIAPNSLPDGGFGWCPWSGDIGVVGVGSVS